jgi:hypothetical protein
MRRTWTIFFSLVLATGLIGPAGAVTDLVDVPAVGAAPIPGASATSDNVTHVGYLPEVGPSVSGRVVEVAPDDKRFYVASIGRGLSIYDVNDPADPQLLGALPIGGFQNEDLAVSADGDIAVLAYDTTGANFFIDTSDPTNPVLGTVLRPGDHTMECVVEDCEFAYGSSGRIFDLSDIRNVRVVGNWRTELTSQGLTSNQSAHAVHRDPATGYILADVNPRVIMDISENPLKPVALSAFGIPSGLRYQHNSLLPLADQYEPREAGDDDDALRAGELMMITGETNFTGQCGTTNGPFATVDVRGWQEADGERMDERVLDVYRPPANSTYTDGNPAVNALGCSAHWFNWTADLANEGDYMVALGAFEHGGRFLNVDSSTGDITEVGWFQPFNGSASGAYWVDEEHVYVVDYVRGIDILKFDFEAERPSDDEVALSWLASAEREPADITRLEQLNCSLAMREE